MKSLELKHYPTAELRLVYQPRPGLGQRLKDSLIIVDGEVVARLPIRAAQSRIPARNSEEPTIVNIELFEQRVKEEILP